VGAKGRRRMTDLDSVVVSLCPVFQHHAADVVLRRELGLRHRLLRLRHLSKRTRRQSSGRRDGGSTAQRRRKHGGS
jgi:hypothetical protein